MRPTTLLKNMAMYGTRNPELVLKAFFRSKAIALPPLEMTVRGENSKDPYLKID